MKVIDLQQGSDEWLAIRLEHCCASEAPVVMGEQKYMSRRQLLNSKKGLKDKEKNAFKEALFQRGHKAEADARNHLEIETLEDWPPVVGVRVVDGINMLASFDGIKGGKPGAMHWEHKLHNENLQSNVESGVLEPFHFWQLEHQMLVNGTDECLFETSFGDGCGVRMVYKSVPQRRQDLIAGWKQFLIDLDKHEIEAKPEKVIAEKAELPALVVDVKGSVITSNAADVLTSVKALAQREMAKTLETDQEFADMENLCKEVKKARSAIKKKVEQVTQGFASLADFKNLAGELDGVLQKLQSDGEGKVKRAKEAKKAAVIAEAQQKLDDRIAEMQQDCIDFVSVQEVIAPRPDWQACVKGKRCSEKMQGAIDAELARVMVEAEAKFEVIQQNLSTLEAVSCVKGTVMHIFQHRLNSLVGQAPEAFEAIVRLEISEEQKRIEEAAEQKAREIAEEDEKAKAEAEAAQKSEAGDSSVTEAAAQPVILPAEQKGPVYPGADDIYRAISIHFGVDFSVAVEWVSAAAAE